MEIALSTRLEINALVDELMSEGDTFLAARASRLVEIVPITPRESAFQARVDTTSTGGKLQGAGAAGGTVQADAGPEERHFSIGSDGTFRVGAWRVAHRPARIDVTTMWREGQHGETIARLVYDRASQAPRHLLLSSPRVFRLGIVHFVFGHRFDLWKRPV